MDGFSDIVIPALRGADIRRHRDFITKLFNVTVEFTTDARTAQRTGNEWLKLTGMKEARQKAETYIKGLANPESSTLFNIPEDIIAAGSWNQQLISYVQLNFAVVVSWINSTQILLQGSQVAVGQAISTFDDYVTRTRYATHNVLYQYYQPSQFHQANVPYDRGEGHLSYDGRCKSTEMMSRVNLGADQIVARGAVFRPHNEQQQPEGSSLIKGKTNEGELRDFAQKLDYNDEEIDTAMKTFAASGTNQVLDTNSLLQFLIQLYPRKQPFKRNTESKVVRDSVSPVPQATQNQSGTTEVSQQDKNEPVKRDADSTSDLRHIVVDGSNVAMSHGKKDVFSCKGIQICVDYFKQRGHKEITVFVPQWRKEASKPDRPIEDQSILFELEKEQILSFTPSRRVNGQRVVCYDDRYIVRLAAENDGIIVSNDNFRDLLKENPEWKKVIEERLLMYTFVKDVFMPPDDPLGRRGPKLDVFLRKGTQANPKLCPYMKKCTYGSKCKYYHPEKLAVDLTNSSPSNQKKSKQPQQGNTTFETSTNDERRLLQEQLEAILPNHKEKIKQVTESHPDERSIERLCNMVLN